MSHQHPSNRNKHQNLFLAILLNIIITVAQVVGGVISGSLALLSDALHNFSDVVSLLVSYVASVYTTKQASQNKTFGYKRAEIIAAFINSCGLLVIAFFLIIEAIERLLSPEFVDANLVIWLSLVSIVGNGISVWLLHQDSKNNINIKSSYLHLFTDLLGSVAVLIGGLLMYYGDLFWVDGVLTAGIAIYLFIVGYQLAKKAFKVLMLFTPEDIDVQLLIEKVNALPRVKHMHHVHIWQLNDDELHLEAHIDFEEDIPLSEFDAILEQIERIAMKDFGINHLNIQPEYQKPDNKNIIVQD